MIASDGEVPVFGKASPHPRSYGTFARVLGVYVREKKLLTLEDAVRKMTSFPAGAAGPRRPRARAAGDEGRPRRLRSGDASSDLATFEKPHQYAEGVSLVLVNGQVVFDDGAMTAARPGRVLPGPAGRAAR